MIPRRTSPRAGRRRGPRETIDSLILAEPFPHCKLHDVCLVDWLPATCPGRAKTAHRAVHEIRDRGENRLAQGDTGGNMDKARAETCWQCLDRLWSDNHFQGLRAKAQLQRVETSKPDLAQPAKRRIRGRAVA